MIQVFEYPSREKLEEILARPVMDHKTMDQRVQPILQEVKSKGDQALKELTLRFDGAEVDDLKVSPKEFLQAEAEIPAELKEALQQAKANIHHFHQSQEEEIKVVETMKGVYCWRKSLPIEKVGLYIPGGTAPLFSTILMLGIPAMLAGCREVVLTSPPNKEGKIHPAILYTAKLVGIEEVYKVGGAQAVAAMAYGTETIPQVYKIFGPGNQYVMAAKQAVAREGVAIDMPAGPSEVMVVADSTAPPSFVAADLLAQAEHGIDSQVIMLTDHVPLISEVQEQIEVQLGDLPRKEIAAQALENSRIILLKDREELLYWMNAYAAEHLILSVDESQEEEWAARVETAGSVFLGHYSPESVGDYASGTNHTLPTNGYARAYSGVSLDSFVKKITFQRLSPQGLEALGPHVAYMAEAEELQAHKRAVSIRLEQRRDAKT